MNTFILLAVLAAIQVLPASGQSSYSEWIVDVPREMTMFQTAGVKLITSTFRTLPFVRYLTSCSRMCAMDTRCKSFNFHPTLKICELNSERETPDFMGFIKEEKWEFYALEWFKIDKSALGPCANKECPEGATCLEVCDKDGFSFAECSCLQSKKQKISCKSREEGRWTDWSEWGECSKTCGLGLRFRTRDCTHPITEGDPLLITSDNCKGIPQDVGVCDMGSCPSWKPWSDWSECTAVKSCGEGARYRNRTCNGGVPNIDELCSGDESESEPCFQQSCEAPIRLAGTDRFGEGRVEIYNDLEEAWGGVCGDQWDINDGKVACQQALHLDQIMDVAVGADYGNIMFPVMLTKLDCKGTEDAIQECQHDGWRPLDQRCQAGAAGVKCVVDGVWNEWSSWSECSQTCDWGFLQRTRECNHPPPINKGKDCPGRPTQRKKCYEKICPVDGVWLAWSSWGECSLTCGKGYRYRNRTCEGPFYDGAPCPTDPQGEIGFEPCNVQRCPFRNCEEYSLVDGESSVDGTFLVDPDGPEILEAYPVDCDFKETKGEGLTILNHDSLERGYVQGYEASAEYERQVNYKEASLEQAKALVDSSLRCEQFVKWECKSASIHEPVHTYEENKTMTLTFVTGRDHEQLDFFPGGAPGTDSCACWANKTCENPEQWCNCDANLDDKFLEDSGVVDTIQNLPLTAFFAGDTGATWEEGYHTIGPLRCWGTHRNLQPGQTHPMESIKPTEPPIFG